MGHHNCVLAGNQQEHAFVLIPGESCDRRSVTILHGKKVKSAPIETEPAHKAHAFLRFLWYEATKGISTPLDWILVNRRVTSRKAICWFPFIHLGERGTVRVEFRV